MKPDSAGREGPNFLIVGAPRCGTTSLFRYLSEHPDVFMPEVKEIRYFDENYHKGRDWYLAHFSSNHGQSAVGEASPGYMYNRTAIKRMALDLPEAKLIACLRHPVDRAVSHYWMRQSLGVEDRSLLEAVETELDDLGATASAPYRYIDRSRYAGQMKALEDHYGRESIHVALFDDLVDQPLSTTREVLRFLGVDPGFEPSLIGTAVNRHVTFRSRTLRRRAKNAPPLLKRVIGRLNTKTATYERLDPSLRRRLIEYFEDDIALLESWLGRDLSAWRA